MTKIGWIGTGVMGSSMCLYTSKKADEAYVYTRTKEKANELISNGAIWCDSIKDLSQKCDIIFTIVGFPKDVEEVYLTDGNYVVQYIYSEDELPIAETGIFEDLYVFYFVVFSTASVVLLNWRPRRRKS